MHKKIYKKKNSGLSCFFIFILIISFVLSFVFKSTANISDIMSGNSVIVKSSVKEIFFNISIGAFSSALVALFIEKINNKKTLEKNRIIKRLEMKKFAQLVNKTLYELNGNSDRGIKSVIYNYHHLEFLINNRVIPIGEYCNQFFEKYYNTYEENEIKILEEIRVDTKSMEFIKNSSWQKYIDTYNINLERLYAVEVYNISIIGKDFEQEVNKNINELHMIIEYHKKYVDELMKHLNEIKIKMPYIFE